MKCPFCHDPVVPNRTAYQMTVGWERKPLAASRKSGSDIVLRERRDVWAHAQCIDRAKLGIPPKQAELAL